MPRSPKNLDHDDIIQVGRWAVQGNLTRDCIEGKGPAQECDGTCCSEGVYTSLEQRDRILQHADRIGCLMDDTQTADASGWFDDEVFEDEDFPGGLCALTRTFNDKCVFLNGAGRCVLQTAEQEMDLPEGTHLKPWYCFLFPLTTCLGAVHFDEIFEGNRPCCTRSSQGGTPAVDALEFELKLLLGESGYVKLLENTKREESRDHNHQGRKR